MKQHLLIAALCAPAPAQLVPDWIARLPVGTALGNGISGSAVDAAGVTYVTGDHRPGSSTDIITAAHDADGVLLWTQSFDGPLSSFDQAADLTLGPGGVLYVTGSTAGPGSVAQVLLLAYERSTGALLNSVQFSSSGGFFSEAGRVLVTDAAGNVYIGGSTGGDGSDVLVVKLDPAGNVLWTQTWDGPALGRSRRTRSRVSRSIRAAR